MTTAQPTAGIIRWNAVCIDCSPREFDAVVSFYRDFFGLQVDAVEDRWAALLSPNGGMGIAVQAEDWYMAPVWPEEPPAQAKMMHFEVRANDVADAVERAVSFGAFEAPTQPADRDQSTLRVMLDPAGHPFCIWS